MIQVQLWNWDWDWIRIHMRVKPSSQIKSRSSRAADEDKPCKLKDFHSQSPYMAVTWTKTQDDRQTEHKINQRTEIKIFLLLLIYWDFHFKQRLR